MDFLGGHVSPTGLKVLLAMFFVLAVLGGVVLKVALSTKSSRGSLKPGDVVYFDTPNFKGTGKIIMIHEDKIAVSPLGDDSRESFLCSPDNLRKAA